MIPLWNDLASRAQLSLTEQQHALLSRYLDLLLDANAKMNLTRIDDRSAAEVQHVGDALTLLPFLPRDPHTLADVGSGGGVPGIPLAIVRPDAQVTLIEVTRKKADFLHRTVEALDLPNVTILSSRAEDVGRGALRESFDVVTARALAELVWLVEWCLPLLKIGGRLLAMKGPKVHEEIPHARQAILATGGGAPSLHPVELPGIDNHLLVMITKAAPARPQYPRLAGQAKGRPLR
jgi:16S rRNA (guanine527-N7)-methyltransferase